MTGRVSAVPRAPHYPRCQHRAYHLTCDEQESLIARGNGLCHICQTPSPHRLQIDHDHGLGWRAVRGLLCPSCNKLMGVIDAGLREPDERFRRYLADPWHIAVRLDSLNCPEDCRWSTHKDTTRWLRRTPVYYPADLGLEEEQ